MRRSGPVQYPRSALQVFVLKYGGYLVDGRIYYGIVAPQTGVWEDRFSLHPVKKNRVQRDSDSNRQRSAFKTLGRHGAPGRTGGSVLVAGCLFQPAQFVYW